MKISMTKYHFFYIYSWDILDCLYNIEGKHMGACIKDHCFRAPTIPALARPPGKLKEEPQVVSVAGQPQIVCPTVWPDNGKLLPRVIPGSWNLLTYSTHDRLGRKECRAAFPTREPPTTRAFYESLLWITLNGSIRMIKCVQIIKENG